MFTSCITVTTVGLAYSFTHLKIFACFSDLFVYVPHRHQKLFYHHERNEVLACRLQRFKFSKSLYVHNPQRLDHSSDRSPQLSRLSHSSSGKMHRLTPDAHMCLPVQLSTFHTTRPLKTSARRRKQHHLQTK